MLPANVLSSGRLIRNGLRLPYIPENVRDGVSSHLPLL